MQIQSFKTIEDWLSRNVVPAVSNDPYADCERMDDSERSLIVNRQFNRPNRRANINPIDLQNSRVGIDYSVKTRVFSDNMAASWARIDKVHAIQPKKGKK